MSRELKISYFVARILCGLFSAPAVPSQPTNPTARTCQQIPNAHHPARTCLLGVQSLELSFITNRGVLQTGYKNMTEIFIIRIRVDLKPE